MSRVLDIAWREFRYTVMTRAFLLAAVVLPLVMWALLVVLPGFLRAPPSPLSGRLLVADESGLVARAVRAELDPERARAEREARRRELEELLEAHVPEAMREAVRGRLEQIEDEAIPEVEVELHPSSGDVDELKERVRSRAALALAVFRPEVLAAAPGTNRYELFVSPSLVRRHTESLKEVLSRAVVRARGERAGLDLEATRALLDPPMAMTSTLTAEGGEARSSEMAQVFVPFAFMLLLWMSTMMTGNHLLTSTIEEKSNKVIEVLLSAVSPLQIMAGKILGQGLVGLTMIALYAALGAGAAQRMGYAHLVPAEKLGYLALYFLMAYFLVASIYAAIGSAVNELREAQSLVGPATMVFMVPLIAWFFISDNPNSTFATVLSFVPPLVPFTMILRVTAIESVPAWQVWATSAVGFAAVGAMVWVAARVFRVGVLMYGKPPSPAELWKWVRQA